MTSSSSPSISPKKLVKEGVPFRQAHEEVGKLVGEAVASRSPLADVVRDDVRPRPIHRPLRPGHGARSSTLTRRVGSEAPASTQTTR